MPTKKQFLQHTFAGGWATAFGPNASEVQPEGRFVRIPFLWEAEDLLYELDGGVRTAPGLSKLNSSVLESGAEIEGIYDYWRQGTGGSPAQKRVVYVNGKLYKDDADGTFTSIKTGLQTAVVPNFATFDDLLIIANDSSSDVPMTWDQTTFQNLAGSPPNFAFSARHKNSLFAAGVVTAPSTLYFSDDLDPENWSTGTSGNISIDPNDGDKITGIVSYKNELWVFKGPHKGSIHRITGSIFGGGSADIGRTTFIEGVGSVNMESIFAFGDDIGYVWADGTIRTLKSTAAFGDYRETSLSTDIQNYLDEHLTFNSLKTTRTAVDASGKRIYFAMPIDASTVPNTVLVLDTRFQVPRWSRIPAYTKARSVTQVVDAGKPKIFFGSSDGFVRKAEQDARLIDGSSGLSFKITTPFMNYGLVPEMKTLNFMSTGIQGRIAGNFSFKWQRDTNTQQTETLTQPASNVLGVASNPAIEFKLDDPVRSLLGGAKFTTLFREMETGGDFRDVQYQFLNSTAAEDLEIHNFGVSLSIDAESTEN